MCVSFTFFFFLHFDIWCVCGTCLGWHVSFRHCVENAPSVLTNVCAVYSENYQYNCDSKNWIRMFEWGCQDFKIWLAPKNVLLSKKTFFGEVIFETFKDFIGAQNAKNFKSQFLWIFETFTFIWIVHLACVCVVHVALFCFWTVGGFVPHVWVHVSFRHCVETLLPCSLVCLCVGWLNVSLVLGSMHHNVIVWGCICVLSVCMSVSCLCMRFCGDVVKFFALARCVCVCVCGGVVQPKSTPDEKTKTNHKKTQNHEKQITWTTHTRQTHSEDPEKACFQE